MEASTHQEVIAVHVLMQDAVVDGGQRVGAREAESKDAEMSL